MAHDCICEIRTNVYRPPINKNIPFKTKFMSTKNRELLLFGEESNSLRFRKLETSDFDNWLEFCSDLGTLKARCEACFFTVMNRYVIGRGGRIKFLSSKVIS
jgi:hypothetical protein